MTLSRILKLCLMTILACVCQTNLSQYIRIAGVAPDMLIVILVLISMRNKRESQPPESLGNTYFREER